MAETPDQPRSPLQYWLGIAAGVLALFSAYSTIRLQQSQSALGTAQGKIDALTEQHVSDRDFVESVLKYAGTIADKKPNAKIVLIGLYGEAARDAKQKYVLANLAAASCSNDEFTTISRLMANDPDVQNSDGGDPSLNAARALAASCGTGTPVDTLGTQTIKNAAAVSLLGALTPQHFTGWIYVGTAPLGNERRPTIGLNDDSEKLIQVVSQNGNPIPGGTNELQRPPASTYLLTKANAVLHDGGVDPRHVKNFGPVIGIIRSNTLVKVSKAVGVDLHDTKGKKIGYAVWVLVQRVTTSTGVDFSQ